jgi:hypothetical protein
MPKKRIQARLTLRGADPAEIQYLPDDQLPELTKAQAAAIGRVEATVEAYLTAIDELLAGKYSAVRDLVPGYLSNRGTIFVAVSSDGVTVRFEAQGTDKRLFVFAMPEPLAQVIQLLSQDLIHCYADPDFTPTVPSGIRIRLGKIDGQTGQQTEMTSFRVGFHVVLERPDHPPAPMHKPFCLFSVRNSFELHVRGLAHDNHAPDEGRPFIIRSPIRLPVGWECIEAYPSFDLKDWNPRFASVWAEDSILAAVVARQTIESQFQSLDPNAAARRHFAAVLQEYRILLDSPPDREETLQRYMRAHPYLLCPSRHKMWPKLSLGAHQTDFVFQDATGDYLLVELEQSRHTLFRADGHPSSPLNVARGQILDWKRYLEDNLPTVQREIGLTGISSNPNSLIVIGRSESLTIAHRRKLKAMENESPKTRIMTYDDIYDNAKATIENLLGPIWDPGGNTQIYYPQAHDAPDERESN